MYHGLHGPNADFGLGDDALIWDDGAERPRFQAVKLMHTHGTQHTLANVAYLKSRGIERLTMRLWDSVWPADQGHPQPYIPDPHTYGDKCIETVREFAPAGVLDYQLDNEPNISRALMRQSPTDYATWLGETIEYITQTPRLPAGVRFGFPPISFADEHHPYDWLGPLIHIAPIFDWLAVNSYYQSDRVGRTNILAGPMTWHQFGGNCEWYMHWQPGMKMKIVEWANSIHEQTINGVPVHTPAQVDALRREQYPIFVEWLSGHPDIEDAFVYISRCATDQWGGFKFPIDVADCMAATMRYLQGQSQRMGSGMAAL
jgi:hypothetical protein